MQQVLTHLSVFASMLFSYIFERFEKHCFVVKLEVAIMMSGTTLVKQQLRLQLYSFSTVILNENVNNKFHFRYAGR